MKKKDSSKHVFLCGCFATCLKCGKRISVPKGTKLKFNQKLKDWEMVCKECKK
jgi:hypothetical protein